MRKGTTYSKACEQAYWEHVQVLDTFWRRTFPSFVSPLAGFYRDPMSAGAQILSRYLDAPGLVAKEIWTHPENFGRLDGGTLAHAKADFCCLSQRRLRCDACTMRSSMRWGKARKSGTR